MVMGTPEHALEAWQAWERAGADQLVFGIGPDSLEGTLESKRWEVARAEGVLTLREDALVKAFDKKIPFSEVTALSAAPLSGEGLAETTDAAPPPVHSPEEPVTGDNTSKV